MFTPEKMEQIQVVFYEKEVDAVADAVVRQGTLQIVDSAEVESWAQNLSKVDSGEETGNIRTHQERLENLLRDMNLSNKIEGISSAEEEWRDLDSKVEEIESFVKEVLKSRDEIAKELSRLKELRDRVGEIPAFSLPIENRTEYSYLAVETGKVDESNMEILRRKLDSILHVLSILDSFGGMATILVIVLKRDHEKLRAALKEAGFQPLELKKEDRSFTPEILNELDQKTKQLSEKLVSVEERMQKIAQEYGSFLKSVLYRVRKEILKKQILKYFRRTERTFLLSGWLPRDQRDAFIQEIRRVTQNRCVIEETPAENVSSVREGKIQVPVKLKNPLLLKPFELITSAYGVPDYRTIDPTPLLGISFLFMFGMMFGDVGHGFILTLVGIILALKGKRGTHRSAGMLLFYGGCASIFFGLLFGSIFGIETLLPAIWVKPMESITKLFKIAIFLGIGMISLAIGVNVVNGIRKRDFFGMIFDKAGLLAAVLYWCGIAVITRLITEEAGVKREVPFFIMVLMLVSVSLLFLREPIMYLFQGKHKLFPEGVTTGIMGGIVEILEILLGFLANTVSFIRVAAFGLAHAGLFMAIFALADSVQGIAGGAVSILVLILGNVGIIALEGLVVTIQAVRLEFYEFFSRFFEQGSISYRPLSTELEGG